MSEYAAAERHMIAAHRCRHGKKEFLSWLKLAPCMDCGQALPVECMDFDHRPGTTKEFALSYGPNHEWEALVAEIVKCDLVCANCHRIRTSPRMRRRV